MRKPNHKELLEMIGVIAVIGSLIFVGLQLMLDRRLALADTYSFSADGRRSDTRTKLESDAYMSLQDKLWAAGVRPLWWNEELSTTDVGMLDSGADIMAAYLETRLGFLDHDEVYYQYQQGLLPQVYWDGAKQALAKYLKDPFKRAVILDQAAPLQTIVSELLQEID
ncbi:MAG: hypothetical protein ACI8XU_000040 [Kiritimatiellia bacterium]|jgi:hypothetical protein